MKATVIDAQLRSFAIIFDDGDEVISGIEQFARENDLQNAQFTAIGAFRRATFGHFHWDGKDNKRIPMDEQLEVLTMTGNVVAGSDGHKVDANTLVTKTDGTTHGGQLLEAVAGPKLEVMLNESPRSDAA